MAPRCSEGERLNVEVSATDNGGVSHVHLMSSVGDLDVDLTSAPYSATFVVPVGVTSVTFTATAFDGWGNSAVSTSTASVIPGRRPRSRSRRLWRERC
jgi:hypothetical protein